jgi:UDP-4-amino-4,6-dideoxy-N-acetyl-beta-L-altrosamine transaminase
MRAIPYGRQTISDADVDAVIDVLRSDFLTQGPAVPAFEQALAVRCGAREAIAVNSATSALHLACLALGVGPGDRVWTTPVTFVASANCARYCGADVEFVDIDPATYNMSVDALIARLEHAEREGRLPAVVIPVHLAGQACDMAAIATLATRFGFRVIEDASHAIGGGYRGAPIGNGVHSDITVFSFHPVKIVTTGEGGVALTNDPALAARMRLLRSHGITRDSALMGGEPDGPWAYEQLDLGFNYRLTDLQAALGRSQLSQLDAFIGRRRELVRAYNEQLRGLPVVTPWQHPDTQSAWHLYIIRLRLAEVGYTRREVFQALRAAGIGVNVHYIPVYRQPYYRAHRETARAACPEAERYYAEAITLPLFPGLSDDEQASVVAALRAACTR